MALDVVYLCDVVILGIVRRMLPTLGKGADFAIFTTSFRDSLAQEIDFIREERYQSKFRKICESHPIYSQSNKIAKTYREYTTTKLLTMELVKNYHRLDRLLDELTPEQLLDFATTRIEGLPKELPLHLIWVQICIQLEGLSHWGLSHGDVHLGNMYALAPEKEGDPWRIFLCDFGMMIEQTERERMLGVEAGMALSYLWNGGLLAVAFAHQGLKPITPQNMLGLRNAMGTLTDKHFTELRDGAEKRWLIRTQRGTSLSMVSEITYSASVFGLSISPFGWLLLKNFSYLVNMGLTMWTSYSPGNMWAPHCKKYVKDVVHYELDTRNITNMRDSLPGILMNLRPYDQKQILTCLSNGGKVKPMEIVWVDDWDPRGLSSQQPA